MKDEVPKTRDNNNNNNRPRKSKFADQNEAPKNVKSSNISNSASKLKCASTWGSNIVKGFGGERKSKLQSTSMAAHRLFGSSSSNSNSNSKTNTAANRADSNSSSKVKSRGLISDFSCSVAPTQVHPHNGSNNNNKLTASQDLFVEIENLRVLLKESKQREFQLQTELSECRKTQNVSELEEKKNEVECLSDRIKLLESENISLKEQLSVCNSGLKDEFEKEGMVDKWTTPKNVEMEVVELRRLNKELQLQKRNLSSKVASLESQLSNLVKLSESEILGKTKAEASLLRRTNEDLSKQVEGLQISRLNEVEELAYLRWVNAQLRNELRSPCLNEFCTQAGYPEHVECDSAKTSSVVMNLNSWPETNEDLSMLEENSSGRRHSICGSKCCDEDSKVNRRRQSDGFLFSKEAECKENLGDSLYYQKQECNKVLGPTEEIEKRALRIPNPPPRPSSANSSEAKESDDDDGDGNGNGQTPVAPPPLPPPPPPPPPPPQRFSAGSNVGAVQRAPQVVEFYHSLMRRDTRRDSSGGAVSDSPNLSNVRSNMIGEIENRSSYLLAIKADVETQGEFVKSLIKEVNNAVFQNIDDVVEFVKWLDDELCFLVDERAVLKHFDWPEKKADTLREAAFGYKDLIKLELEVIYYHDDPRSPCDIALRKMVSLSEKIERTIYSILRTRESLMRSCKEFKIPTDWMLDSGIINKIKLGSVKLAKKYMNRVATELQSRSSIEKDIAMDYMLLQGVRFAFRIHQFAGGFDAETMQAFEQLRKLAHAPDKR